MTPFRAIDGALHCEETPLAALADAVGTPFYVYSANAMRARCRALIDAFAHRPALICYALKANHNLAVVKLMLDEGAGADTVSAGEIARARAAGAPPQKIVFAGVAKGDDEIEAALGEGVLQFNVESAQELERIAAVARAMNVEAPIALRVNPNVAAGGHDKISTGRSTDKFGVPIGDAPELFRKARALGHLRPIGVHLHIGSQILETAPYERAYAAAADIYRALQDEGFPLRHLDLGGGMGVSYDDEQAALDAQAYARAAERAIGAIDGTLLFEPGRSLVAAAGAMATRLIYVKENAERRFAVVDAGMNTLVRPAMYGARHRIAPAAPRPGPQRAYDVVGPICESSDVFGRDYRLSPLERGDLLAFLDAGAYGAVMASDYNSRARPAEVLVDGAHYAIIKPRREPQAQFDDERCDWR